MANILVVDDNPLSRQSLATVLSYHGHQINEARDGVDGLEVARKQRPDLIIADPAVRRMGGSELVRAFRANQELARIPIVFCTAGHREDASRAIASATGVEHVITKPASPGVILDTVQSILGLPVSGSPVDRVESSAGYIERLQLAVVRMSALIELSLHLRGERDSDRLLRTACRAARTMLDSDYAVIALIDRAERVRSWVDGPVDQLRLDSVVVREIASKQTLRRGEGASDPLVQVVREAMPRLHAVLSVPMQSHGRRICGSILIGRARDGAGYSSDDERLAVALASEIRAAHANVTQLRAQREKTAELAREHGDLETMIEHIEDELSSSRLDLAALFESSPLPIVGFDQDRFVRAWNHAAERTFGWRADEVIGERPPPFIPPASHEEFESLVARCLAGATLTDVQVQRARKDGTRIDVSLSMAPLYDAHGNGRGFVSIINDITGRKRSEEELRASRERLRGMSARVLSIQEEERTRIARELHDDLAQLLTAIKFDAARLIQDVTNGTVPPARVMEGILPLIDTTLDAVGRIVSELRPSRIGEMGLTAAIEKKLADFQQRTDIECELSIRPALLHIPDDIAAAVFRIVEEALTNIARHSGATRAEVRVRQQEEELLLEVRDNGRGIRDAEKVAGDAYGIMGMNERAYLFGGTLTITGVEDRGTIVAARIPLDRGNGDLQESP